MECLVLLPRVGFEDERQDIVTLEVLDQTELELHAEVLKLQHRIRVLGAVVRLLLQLLRMSGFRLEVKRIAPSPARTALLRAVEQARELLHPWCSAALGGDLVVALEFLERRRS